MDGEVNDALHGDVTCEPSHYFHRCVFDDVVEQRFVSAIFDATGSHDVDPDVVENRPRNVQVEVRVDDSADSIIKGGAALRNSYGPVVDGGKVGRIPSEGIGEEHRAGMDEHGGEMRRRMENERIVERAHRPSERSVGDDEQNLEQELTLRVEPDVQNGESVGPVAEIEQVVVLPLLLESPPTMSDVENGFWSVPQVVVLRSGTQQVRAESKVDDA